MQTRAWHLAVYKIQPSARTFLMSDSNGYRVRFRFKLLKKLSVDDRERRLIIGGCEVVLASQFPDRIIADDDWLVMNARGFDTEPDATLFAHKLKAASELSSVIARLGIDAGVERATSGFGRIVKDQVFASDGIVLRDNIHGLDVFADDPNIRVGHFTATATIRSNPDPFLGDLPELYDAVSNASPRVRDIVLLLNYALTRTDPVAQIVFAISAVEMLGQDRNWSPTQKELLEKLAAASMNWSLGTDEERTEVAVAIRRGMHKLSLRQGVFRLLGALGLDDLRMKWDEVYGQRSTLVHGLAPKPGVDYGDLAYKSVSLCGRVLLTAIAREVGNATRHLDAFYPLH
jgi:hypothetical protein